MKILFDQQPLDVEPGTTLLEAARLLGVEIPTLCHLEGHPSPTTCQVCLVKLKNENRFVPACATVAAEGMEVESQTDEVRRLRARAVELLLADHRGECLAPCQVGCPLSLEVPGMILAVEAGRFEEAARIVRRDCGLGAILSEVCSRPCEKVCRLGRHGTEPVAVCQLKRFAVEAAPVEFAPLEKTNLRSVAIVGTGMTGLSAAFFLRQNGLAVTLFESAEEPGGRLQAEIAENRLARETFEKELDPLWRADGVSLELNRPIGEEIPWKTLRERFDAVLVAWGPTELERVEEGFFVAGRAARAGQKKLPLERAAAEGKRAARAIMAFLRETTEWPVNPSVRVSLGRLDEQEYRNLAAGASDAPRHETIDSLEAARSEAARCLKCGCRQADRCQLRQLATELGVNPRANRLEERRFERLVEKKSGLVFEPGKCIQCGRCVMLTAEASDAPGLTSVGRGYEVRIGPPFEMEWIEALGDSARAVVAACPTGALSWETGPLSRKTGPLSSETGPRDE